MAEQLNTIGMGDTVKYAAFNERGGCFKISSIYFIYI